MNHCRPNTTWALWLALLLCLTAPGLAGAQTDEEPAEPEADEQVSEISDEDRLTMALDSTATQWSFQFAWQVMPDYHDDTLDDGSTRPAGNDDFLQLRIVAPLPFKSFTLLPRVTLRHYENAQGQSGIGNTEIFGLIIPKSWDWGSGRFGIGPLVTLPGNHNVAKDEWGYGLAMAAVNGKGNWFYGALLTQSWQSVDPDQQLPPGQTDTNPLGIAPFLNYKLGKGWYVSNGDMVIQYDWDSGEIYVPGAVRFGKVLVNEKSSWNIYGEYRTSLIYENWQGSAVKNSYRFNVTYSLPVG
ncbi:MAG: hypothetical protein WBI27_10790 [Thermoanaerobaculia bacterium]